jgi:hypothetical protein
MEDSHWVDETTLEARLRKGLRYQDGEEVSAESFRRAFEEVQRVMPEAHRDHRTATPGAPRSTTYGHDPYQALSVFLCAPQAVDASTGTSASTATQPPSSWPRPTSPRRTGPAADRGAGSPGWPGSGQLGLGGQNSGWSFS